MKKNTCTVPVSTVHAPDTQTLQAERYSRVLSDELQMLVRRGIEASHQSRSTRVEALQAQVRAGTYKVDSLALAQRMLSKQTYFLEIE